MTETLHETLVDVLDSLTTMARDGARPEEAQARFRRLREQHPEAELELLWEEEAYDQFVHYDALLTRSGEGTVSLSFCPDRALPWPLRGVHRWNDQDLVRVNATVLKVEQAVACLDFIWDEAPLVERLLHSCLVQEELARDPIDLTDAELQEAMDGFRRARRLYTAEDTHRWMADRGITQEKLEKCVSDEALIAKLRGRVAAERVAEYFEAHRSDFDRACVAQIAFSDEESARLAYEQIRAGEMDFHDAARQRALETMARPERRTVETFAVLRRGEASAALTAVFEAAHGDLLPPVRTGDGHVVMQVLAREPAYLDDQTRRTIEQILFREWLEERRRAATIDWNWGNAQRTTAAGRPLSALSTLEEGDR
ncbi:MAG: TIGR04500 family putative peptide maturation system protein [Dehalococcoidia bacterium]